jgi:oligopeptide transport system substrate-binding protein
MGFKIIILAFLAILLIGCDNEGQYERISKAPAGEAYYGGIFRLNEVEDFRNLFPLGITETTSQNIAGQMYEGLVKLNQENLSILPAIAEKWVVNADATSFTFIIRKGIKFHDNPAFPDGQGRELNAHDVKYCFTRLCTDFPENQGFWIFKDRVVGATEYFNSTTQGNPLKEGLRGVKVINKHAIQIDLKYPFPGFLKVLATPFSWIYPKEAYEMYKEDMRLNCAGTGPFKMKTVKEGNYVLLERNENYWATDKDGNQLPYLSAIKVRFYKDKAFEWQEFEKGGLDMVFAPARKLDELEKAGEEIVVQRTPALSVLYYGFQNQGGVFSNKELRKAFNYAIDREYLVSQAMQGLGVPAFGGITPPAFADYDNSQVKGYSLDVEKARTHLENAGFPDGKGFPGLTLLINSGGGGKNILLAEEIQKMLFKNLNVKINIEVLPFKDFLEAVESGRADFFKSNWNADYADPENFLSLLKATNLRGDTDSKAYLNAPRYINQTYDSLIKAGLKEPEIKHRNMFYLKAEQIAMDDAAVMPIMFNENIRVIKPYVRNFPVNAMEYRDFSKVWVEKQGPVVK